MTGMANSSRNCETSTSQEKIGMRMSVMPGALMLSMVTMRLTALTVEAIPVISRPMTQKSMLCPGLNVRLVLGA